MSPSPEHCHKASTKYWNDAGHFLYTQRPDVVTDAVFDILDRVAKH